MSISDDLKVIDEVNKIIDNVIDYTERAFSGLEKLRGQSEKVVQDKVDTLCTNVSNKVNAQLSKIRAKAINILREKYLSSNSLVNKFARICTVVPTIDNVVGTVSDMTSLYTKPYEDSLEYSTNFKLEAIMKLIDLTDNASQLASIKANLASLLSGYNINYDKLNIEFKPITIMELLKGASEEGEGEEQPVKRQYTFNSYSEFKKYGDKYAQVYDNAYVYLKSSTGDYVKNQYTFLPNGILGISNTWKCGSFIYDFNISDIDKKGLKLDSVGINRAYLQCEIDKNTHKVRELGLVDQYMFDNKMPLYLRLGDENTFAKYNYETKKLEKVTMLNSDMPVKFTDISMSKDENENSENS